MRQKKKKVIFSENMSTVMSMTNVKKKKMKESKNEDAYKMNGCLR